MEQTKTSQAEESKKGPELSAEEEEAQEGAQTGKLAEIDDGTGEDVNVVDDEQKAQIQENDLKYLLQDKSWKEVIKHDDADKMIANLIDNGYAKPSKIQKTTIEFAFSQKVIGILAQSHNGSGKTLAFLIPSIMRVDLSRPLMKTKTCFLPQVIIFTPTAELCSQIVQIAKLLSKPFPDLKISSGNEPAHILVRTPGGLLKQISKKEIDLTNINVLVVDEADGLLGGDSGTQLNQVIAKLPKGASLFFFSATFTNESKDYINIFFKKLELRFILRYLLKSDELKLDGIHQFCRRCDPNQKIAYVDQLMKALETGMQIIIFVNTRKFSEIVFKELLSKGHSVGLLIGGQSPQERSTILNSFRSGKFQTLISTNLLARGFDQRTIGLVINLDIPKYYGEAAKQKGSIPDLETYLHRIGRTGRFGDVGLALNLFHLDSEKEMLENIEKYYKVKIEDLSKVDTQKEFDMLNDLLEKVKAINAKKQGENFEKIQK